MYYTLTGQLSKLSTLIFKKIIIEFRSGKKVEIEKQDLELVEDFDRLRSRSELKIIDFINNTLSIPDKALITENIGPEGFKNNKDVSNIINQFAMQLGYPNHFIKRMLILIFSGKSGKIEDAKRTILNELNADILYFPTYRRIEEELNKLGTTDEIKIPHDDKRLIQFGMGDVSLTLTKVIDSIKSSAVIGFSEITGEMLSQYLKATPDLEPSLKEIIKPEILKIILERVGANITSEEKSFIINLVETNAIFDTPNYTYLLNFLTKLIKIYDQQKDTDNSIKQFESICNSYLTGKKIVYDESKVTIKVIKENKLVDSINNNNDNNILLKNLSSGEKQIISLFAKIIFSESENLIILFDEPELSLSMEWQFKLLPDIIKSKKCKLLLSVTHSPFIFDNDLDEYATDMSKYILEYKSDTNN